MRLAGLVALLGAGLLPCHWAPAAVEALPQGQGAVPQEVRVQLDEWSLAPARVVVATGRPVRFIATNSGAIPHALAIKGDGVDAETVAIGSARSVRLDVTFSAAGVYDLFCPIGAGQHRQLGQDGLMAAVAPEPGERYPLSGEPAEALIVAAIIGSVPPAPPTHLAPPPPPEPPGALAEGAPLSSTEAEPAPEAPAEMAPADGEAPLG